MNILIFSPFYLPAVGGVVHVVENLAKHFADLGNNVYLVTMSQDGLPSVEERHRLRIFRAAMYTSRNLSLKGRLMSPLRFAYNLVWLRHLLKEYRIDVINAHFLNASTRYFLSLEKWLRDQKIPVMVTFHGSDVHGPDALIRSDPACEIIRNVDSFTAVSEWLLTEATMILPAIEARGQVIYNGTDPGRFDSSAVARCMDEPYMIAIGNLRALKGTDVLLLAFKRFTQYDLNYRLAILGDGPERERLQQMSRELGVEERVKFFGQVAPEQVAGMMKGADFLVVASRREGFPLVILEAMCARKAAIATRVGGIPEIVKHDETGLLVPPEDAESLCSAMLRLARDPNLSRRLGANGYLYVQQLTWERIAKQYLELYHELIGT